MNVEKDDGIEVECEDCGLVALSYAHMGTAVEKVDPIDCIECPGQMYPK